MLTSEHVSAVSHDIPAFRPVRAQLGDPDLPGFAHDSFGTSVISPPGGMPITLTCSPFDWPTRYR
jgi:hypothetical protein